MFCINCGNKIEEGEKFCGKCGTEVQNKVNENQPIKIKLSNLIIVFVIISALIVGGVLVFLNFDNISKLFSGNDVNDEYIEEILMSGPGGEGYFIKDTTRILAKTDLFYQNYNKLVIYTATIKNNLGQTTSGVGVIILNKQEDIFYSIEINSVVYGILDGLYRNGDIANIEKTAPILAQYVQNYGIEGLAYGNEGYSDLCKEIANIVGIERGRKYANDFLNTLNTSNLNATVLYEKNSVEPKYMAFYQQTTKYNWDVSENIANYWYKTNRDTYYSYELIYGPAYSTLYEYEVISMETQKVVGNYSTLEKAKSSLNVEE